MKNNSASTTIRFLIALALTAAAVPLASSAANTAANTTAPNLTRLRDTVVYQDRRFHCAFPSFVVRPDGEILCAFRRAPSRHVLWNTPHDLHTDPNSYLVMVRSRDNGETWTTNPELIFAHPFGGSQDPCMNQLSDGSIVLSSYGWAMLPLEQSQRTSETIFQHPPYAFLGGYILRSDDGARTWKGPFIPPVTPGELNRDAFGQLSAAFNRGAMTQIPDGTLLWAVACHDSKKPPHTSVHLMKSADRGETWTYGGPIANVPGTVYNETSLVQTASGDVVAFVRNENKNATGAMVRSRDGGKTFGPKEDLNFSGLPFQASRLRDGRILLVYGYRRNPYGIRARLLKPDLSDINIAPEFVLRDDGVTVDLGYPWSTQLPDGNLLVIYYINTKGDPPHIAATLLRPV